MTSGAAPTCGSSQQIAIVGQYLITRSEDDYNSAATLRQMAYTESQILEQIELSFRLSLRRILEGAIRRDTNSERSSI
jgi:hypothetical protein